MKKTIKAAIKRPEEERWHIETIDNTLEALQKIVGGHIETVTLFHDLTIICNEEGRLLDLEPNCKICGVEFVGPLVAVGIDRTEFADVPIEDEATFNRLIERRTNN